jgi:glycerate 2-kinase
MKILIAPQNFKESLSAVDVTRAMADGVLRAVPDAVIDLCPMADGGDGTVETIMAAAGGAMRIATVTGPLGEAVEAKWGLIDNGRTAVIEMAQAAGLELVPDDLKDPTKTTTFGVGELILAALDANPRKIIFGLGGSATTDGGAGMAQALGARFYGLAGLIEEPMRGGLLSDIEKVDVTTLDKRVFGLEIVGAYDVDNPLTGINGAAYIFGPQKGADKDQIQKLDTGLKHLAAFFPDADTTLPGAGAAGGLAWGVAAYLRGRLTPGVDLILDAVRFDERVRDADLVLTGEGKLDGQTLCGKTCLGVAQRAKRAGVPVIALAGAIGDGTDRLMASGLTACFSICPRPMSQSEAMENARDLIANASASVIRIFAHRH